jgi:hypothetical protein
MHARFVVPAFFALLLPASVVAVPLLPRADNVARCETSGQRRRMVTSLLAATAAATWCVFVAFRFGVSTPNVHELVGRYAVFGVEKANPIEPGAYVMHYAGADLRLRAEARRSVLVDASGDANPHPDVLLFSGRGVIAYASGIGVIAYTAGNDVRFVDQHGLADLLASHTEGNAGLNIPGHEKSIPFAAAQGRYALPQADDTLATGSYRSAYLCKGDLHDLTAAASGKLTFGRFFANLVSAPRLTFLRFPTNPVELAHGECDR